MRSLNGLCALGLLILLTFSACKEPDGIGLDVLPDGEEMGLAWIDTFTLQAQTVLYDSVQTSGLNSGTYLVGDFGDPIFGRVRSELYTQIRPITENPDFKSNPVIDSIVLNMAYSGSYGRTDKLLGTMQFGVFELDERLFETGSGTGDTVYYSNDTIATLPTPLATKTFRPDLYSKVIAGNDTLPPSFRIALDPNFGQRILDSDSLGTNESFVNDFFGLCVRPTNFSMNPGSGSILYFNMESQYSRVELYYHNDEGDTTSFTFEIRNSFGIHSTFSHEFPMEILSAIDDSTVTGATRLYVQSMSGLRMKVKIPHLRELRELGAVAINKAELIVPVDQSVITEFGLPTALQITGIDSAGRAINLLDVVEGSDYYGGTYDSGKKQYVFNIARHLQSLLNSPETIDYGLYIVNSGNAVNARRGVFSGPQHPDSPMKLRMTYTIIE